MMPVMVLVFFLSTLCLLTLTACYSFEHNVHDASNGPCFYPALCLLTLMACYSFEHNIHDASNGPFYIFILFFWFVCLAYNSFAV